MTDKNAVAKIGEQAVLAPREATLATLASMVDMTIKGGDP